VILEKFRVLASTYHVMVTFLFLSKPHHFFFGRLAICLQLTPRSRLYFANIKAFASRFVLDAHSGHGVVEGLAIVLSNTAVVVSVEDTVWTDD